MSAFDAIDAAFARVEKDNEENDPIPNEVWIAVLNALVTQSLDSPDEKALDTARLVLILRNSLPRGIAGRDLTGLLRRDYKKEFPFFSKLFNDKLPKFIAAGAQSDETKWLAHTLWTRYIYAENRKKFIRTVRAIPAPGYEMYKAEPSEAQSALADTPHEFDYIFRLPYYPSNGSVLFDFKFNDGFKIGERRTQLLVTDAVVSIHYDAKMKWSGAGVRLDVSSSGGTPKFVPTDLRLGSGYAGENPSTLTAEDVMQVNVVEEADSTDYGTLRVRFNIDKLLGDIDAVSSKAIVSDEAFSWYSRVWKGLFHRDASSTELVPGLYGLEMIMQTASLVGTKQEYLTKIQALLSKWGGNGLSPAFILPRLEPETPILFARTPFRL